MKPRSDSKLKNLPEERQEQIIEWLSTPKSETCPGGIKHAMQQLAADGIKVSTRALSDFWAWWRLRERYSSASSRAEQVIELLKNKHPSLSPEKIRELAQALFTVEAMDGGDLQAYVSIERLVLDRESAEFRGKLETEKLALSREKFEVETCRLFLKWYKDEKAREIAESNLSNADKIAAMRARYFADVEAMDKAGSVVLPE